ncbi:MAG: hypothetical protein Ct9H90mP4_10430 [Gammaproteobacteria bacterium]|nr:MAG: hypothetical protein Ct9H90mP4_10430 [Gammaproteobacteria bacterium]
MTEKSFSSISAFKEFKKPLVSGKSLTIFFSSPKVSLFLFAIIDLSCFQEFWKDKFFLLLINFYLFVKEINSSSFFIAFSSSMIN